MPEECSPHLAHVHRLAVLPHAKAAAVDLKHQPVGSHPAACGGEEKYYSFFNAHMLLLYLRDKYSKSLSKTIAQTYDLWVGFYVTVIIKRIMDLISIWQIILEIQ